MLLRSHYGAVRQSAVRGTRTMSWVVLWAAADLRPAFSGRRKWAPRPRRATKREPACQPELGPEPLTPTTKEAERREPVRTRCGLSSWNPSWSPAAAPSSSGNLASTPRAALASRTACVVLRFHQKRNTAAVRALFDAEKFRLESAARAITAIAPQTPATVHVLPRRSALRARRVLRQRRPPHDLALLAQHGRFDLEPLTLARERFRFQPSERFLFAPAHLFHRSRATLLAAVRTVDGSLQPPDLLLALETLHPRTSGKVRASFLAISGVRQTQSANRCVAQNPYTLRVRSVFMAHEYLL